MTVTLTYDSTLSRVRVAATGLAAADTAVVERSTDGVRWSTVRGAGAVPVSAGVMTATVDDFEFPADVLITYRVRGVESGPIAFRNAGAGAAAANGSVTPTMPAAIVAGDLLMVLASTRNSGTGTVNTPTGYTAMGTSGNFAVFGKYYDGSESAPTVSFTGGATNETTIAMMLAFRSASVVPATLAAQLNGSAQNVAWSGLAAPDDGLAMVLALWKQDDWTSVATPAGFSLGVTASSTLGNDAAQAAYYVIETTATDVPAGALVVTGGAAAISRGITLALQHAPYLNSQTSTITPMLGGIWLKSVVHPFLNRMINVIDWTAPTRAARAGVFDVVGSNLPIAVNDVRGPRVFDLTCRLTTVSDSDDFDAMMSPGDVLLIHTPASCPVPGGYVTVGDTTETRPTPRSTKRYWTLPCTQVRAPADSVMGAIGTWQTVLNTYATWADVIAANPTWADLLALVGSSDDVVVG